MQDFFVHQQVCECHGYVKWAKYLAKAIRDQYLADHPDAPIPTVSSADEIDNLDEDELQVLFVQQVRFVVFLILQTQVFQRKCG